MPIRTYADTSVYGGLHDEEFAEASQRFFDQVHGGRFGLVTSAVVDDELEEEPPEVQADYRALIPHASAVDVTDEALDLQGGILGGGHSHAHVGGRCPSHCSCHCPWM